MKRLLPIPFLLLLLTGGWLSAQNFVNGDLNGTIGISNTPTNWAQVPYLDPTSLSTMTLSATSDVTGTTGPLSGNINGNPYAGTTLVSGLHLRNAPDIWHEGLMQTVSGLTVGTAYNIRFYANVIKQSNATDPTGTWTVYKDNTLIATTSVITDNSAFGSNAHPWFLRIVTFTATATSHMFKFLPRDDDATIDAPNGVRMGIDSITLRPAVVFQTPLQFSLSLQDEDDVRLNWEDEGAAGLSHYLIEHSADGMRFENIGRVEANQGSQFQFEDQAPYLESYYRIGTVMEDGSSSWSEVQSISTQGRVDASLQGRQLSIQGGLGGRYDIELRDMQGRKVFGLSGQDQADLSRLSAGIYFLKVVPILGNHAALERKVVLE